MRSDTIRTAGILIGIGMGGFLDGILFHQIFQLHNMFSAIYYPDTLVNLEINMFWDGMFHSLTWLTTAFGILLLWKGYQARVPLPSSKGFLGSLLFGWGLFNFTEGLLDHHIVEIHHFVERFGLSIWDFVFLSSGILLAVVGWILMQKSPLRSRINSQIS